MANKSNNKKIDEVYGFYKMWNMGGKLILVLFAILAFIIGFAFLQNLPRLLK